MFSSCALWSIVERKLKTYFTRETSFRSYILDTMAIVIKNVIISAMPTAVKIQTLFVEFIAIAMTSAKSLVKKAFNRISPILSRQKRILKVTLLQLQSKGNLLV